MKGIKSILIAVICSMVFVGCGKVSTLQFYKACYTGDEKKVDEYLQYEGWQKRRISFRPGITGLWQVSGRNDIIDFDEVVRLDLEYIDNWTLGLDFKIMAKTLLTVLSGRGAK